mgnify:FL=1
MTGAVPNDPDGYGATDAPQECGDGEAHFADGAWNVSFGLTRTKPALRPQK